MIIIIINNIIIRKLFIYFSYSQLYVFAQSRKFKESLENRCLWEMQVKIKNSI